MVRKEAICKLIRQYKISDHKTLLAKLEAEYGIKSSQTAISRDMQELGIAKIKVGGEYVYDLPVESTEKQILRLAVIEILCNEQLIVVKTVSGLAAFVGDYLDGLKNIGIMATLAGENVVFVTPVSIKSLKKVFEHVSEQLFYKRHEYKEES